MKINFEIKHNSRGCIVVRTDGAYAQHAHISTLRTCHELLKLIELNKLPRSKYLQGSCKRLLTDEEYGLLRESKQMYVNVNKGVR